MGSVYFLVANPDEEAFGGLSLGSVPVTETFSGCHMVLPGPGP